MNRNAISGSFGSNQHFSGSSNAFLGNNSNQSNSIHNNNNSYQFNSLSSSNLNPLMNSNNNATNNNNNNNNHNHNQSNSKDLSIHLGGALTALNLSHDKRQVAVVGREVLKIVSISEEEGLKESQNLRVGKVNLNYSSVDVRWHPSEQHRHLIATAATNGAVVIWNNHNVGSQKQERIINDHTRTVNRISWHPEHPWTLLSGSQDGTMKLWDIRDPNSCKVTFDGKSECVRDVKFNNHYPNLFAAAFDNGTIQIWDIRKHSSYETSITAHQGPVFCIDWHPEDKSIIATGGRDRFIQVWELPPKGKPIYTIQTVSSVSHVAWRPGHKYHIASSALVESKIHVWNVKKPFIPNLSFIGHHDVVTDINWYNSDKILSCGKDSTLQLQNAKYAFRPYQHIRSTGITWNPTGQLAFVNEKINRANTLLAEESMDQKNRKVVFSKNGTKKSLRLNEANEIVDAGEGSSISVFLAERYKFEEKELPFPDLCQHNADVAKEAKQYQIAQSWTLLKLFFENNDQPNYSLPSPPQKESSTLPRQHTNKPSLSPPLRIEPEATDSNPQMGNVQDSLFNLFESEPGFLMNGNSFMDGNHPYIAGDLHMDEVDFLPSDVNFPLAPLPLRNSLQFDDPSSQSNALDISPAMGIHTIPKESKRDKKKLIATSGQFKTFGNLFGSDLPFDPKPAVLDMLQHYAEVGDIQSAVIMSLVLGDRVAIPPEKLKQWSLSYIEILHRLQLWHFSNEIIKKSKDQSIRSINQTSTTVHTSCNHCGKPLLHLGWICETCHKLTNPCSLCHRPVHGRYSWCQICGHGGHLDHLAQWFSTEKQCPTGCGHKCQIYIPNGGK